MRRWLSERFTFREVNVHRGFLFLDDENPRGQSESSKTRRRLIMKCSRTSRHFSRHLLSFSPSEALHLRHLLTFLLIGLTFLRSVLPCDYEKSRLRENEPEQLLTNKDIGYPRDEANKEQQEQWTAQTEKENKPILKFPRRSEVEYSNDELARSDFILNDDIFMKDLLIKENGLSTRRRKRRKKSRTFVSSSRKGDPFVVNDTDSLVILCENTTVCDSRKENDTNPSLNGTSLKFVTENVSKVLEEDAPFVGFEGSQKFPVKVTHKPPLVVPQLEKFDRRHFRPPKVDVQEPTESTTPMEPPDLPKSPSRDVPLRRKTEEIESSTIKETEEEENISQTSEVSSTTTDAFSKVEIVSTIESTIFPVSTSTGEIEMDPLRENIEHVVNAEETTTKKKEEEDSVTNPSVFEKINVTILGLFEMTQGQAPRSEGLCELQAARLAVDRVNEMNILRKFHLHLIHNDTKVGSRFNLFGY